jgi:long-chain acyl-CoA synthetase
MHGGTVAATDARVGSDDALPWLRSYPPGISWDMAFPAETLPEMFDASVARFGPKTCMDFMGRRLELRRHGRAGGQRRGGLPPPWA